MKKTKILVVALAITALVIGLFTGCSCSSGGSNSSDNSTKNTSESSSKKDTTSSYVSGQGFTVNIDADLSKGEWYVDESYAKSGKTYFYNVASKDKAYSNTPRIQFQIEKTETVEKNKNGQWQNVTEVPAVKFGDLEGKGYKYTNVGMEWTNYVIPLSDTVSFEVIDSGVDVSDGTDGGNVFKSLKFTVNQGAAK